MKGHPTGGEAFGSKKVSVDYQDLDWILQQIEKVEAHAKEAKSRADSIEGIAFQLRHQVRAMMRPEAL